jgi:hypothetical protein
VPCIGETRRPRCLPRLGPLAWHLASGSAGAAVALGRLSATAAAGSVAAALGSGPGQLVGCWSGPGSFPAVSAGGSASLGGLAHGSYSRCASPGTGRHVHPLDDDLGDGSPCPSALASNL